MTRRRLLAVLLVAGFCYLLLGGLLLRSVCRSRRSLFQPPAPAAPQAPGWKPQEPQRADAQTPPEQPPARYQWPADFNPPLEIVIDNVPDVPEKIVGPSPPIDQQ
jgi:hypothetical protein